jgi:hypothetical protein
MVPGPEDIFWVVWGRLTDGLERLHLTHSIAANTKQVALERLRMLDLANAQKWIL